MSMLAGVLRGIRHRVGASIGILLVATVAAAAAATGPAYDAAARASILRDSLQNSPAGQLAVQASDSGPVAGLASGLRSATDGALAAHLGGTDALSRMFQPPVQSLLAQVITGSHLSPLTWRTGACAHLRLVAGTCPAAAGQVLVSTSFASLGRVRPGDTFAASSGFGRLTVTGEYAAPGTRQLSTGYWLTGACDDFSYEDPCLSSSGATRAAQYDALFTPAATFAAAGPAAQGEASAFYQLAPAGVRAGDLPALTAGVSQVLTDPRLQLMNASVTSSIPQVISQVTASWQTLDVPVFLVSCEIVLLGWLLLFLIATDAAEARAGEIALAKLRGHGRLRVIAFGLSEPAALLAAGFVAGAAAGWGTTAWLAGIMLRPGTPAGLPWLAIAAAAAASLGGMAAVLLAARRALARPITRQWQHAARGGPRRGWTLDAVLLTCALAGLAELVIAGHVTSARSGSLGLLVPGLIGLAAAVVASRVLPAACALAATATRRRGGTGLFLAVRHIARRPGGTRTTIVLTAAFALAAFAIAGYAVDQRNVDRVAIAQTGAAAVLTVQPPAGQDLGAIVDRIDPSGDQAVAVDRYDGGASNGSVLLAVQPQRWARVAQWQPGFLTGTPASVAAALSPRVAPPVTLPAGASAVRIQVSDLTGAPPGARLTVWAAAQSSGGQVPVSLGPLRDGTLSGTLSGCPCQVTMVTVDTSQVTAGGKGGMLLSGLSVNSGQGWQPVPGALASADGWAGGAEAPAGCQGTTGQLREDGGGLRWSFTVAGACSPAVLRQDTPNPLPALVAGQLTSGSQPLATSGLDGQQLMVKPAVLAAAVPGAPATGVVVDRTYAELAASYTMGQLEIEQVWTAPGALGAIEARLKAAGVGIESVATSANADRTLMREGPALASVLFLAAAVAAALLASGAAVLGLYQAGRRRRYEYAALIVGQVPRRTLRAAVFIEQGTVLGFGVLTGVAAGIGAAALVLRNLPEFIAWPASPPLDFAPPAAPVVIPLVAIAVLLAAAVTAATVTLIRSVRPELLREVPP